MTSEWLSPTQLAGLVKVGDVLVPGEGDLPSLSASNCAVAADRLFAHMAPGDRDAVRILLGVFRWLPRPVLYAIFWVTSRHRIAPEPIARALRLMNLGVKGIVMTLYWSDVGEGPSVRAAIGWDATVVETELQAAATPRVEPVPVPEEPPPASAAADAFARARRGIASLQRLSLADRIACIERLQDGILAQREEIIDRIQHDTGKSRSDALISEIFGVLDNLAWLAKFAPKHLADHKQHTGIALMGKTSWTWYEPLGTILVISPWNYPFYQAIVPIAQAFACGNTVVYKPSEWTPLEGLVEELLENAGFAPNWVRVVYGDGSVGADLVDQRPEKIFFTGSTRTGKKILAQAAPLMVPVELELGGKDPMIVFDDVNVDRAAAGAAWGALTTTGQSCTSVERLYVQEPIYDRFREALVRDVNRLRQEIDRDGDADLGAMTTDFQVKVVARHLEDAEAKGARVLTGDEWDRASRLIPPIVLDRVTDDMLVAREETFGPVIPLMPFRTEDEVVRRANDSEYGLTASVWTHDLERAKRVGRALAAGGVSINNVMATEANPALPFGGIKQSGFGRYKGEHGLHAFCNVKSVLVDKDSAKIEANWYPYTREKYRLFTDLMVNLFGRGPLRLVRFAVAGMRLERYSKRAAKDGGR
jgi:aldehyde dehydrogenase (NAD+)